MYIYINGYCLENGLRMGPVQRGEQQRLDQHKQHRLCYHSIGMVLTAYLTQDTPYLLPLDYANDQEGTN